MLTSVNSATTQPGSPALIDKGFTMRTSYPALALAALPLLAAFPAQALVFTPGDLVVGLVGNVDGSGPYTDNQATPVMLQQLTTAGVAAGSIVLTQQSSTSSGVTQSAFSGEYGSSSEGLLQRSADKKSLVIAGYGVNAATYNAGGAAVYGNAAEAQSTSLQGGSYTAVPRVVANIRADGSVDTSTAIYGIYNTNNPRSVATVDGSTFYLGGQGVSGDTTQGVFVANRGASTATLIDGTTDVRSVQIANGQLYASRDSKQNNKQATITTYGSTLPTGATAGTNLPGIGPTVTLTAAQANGTNTNRIGTTVYLSPEQYFFANATTLYIADAGKPKNGNAGAAGEGDGGLQKWVLANGTWSMAYNLTGGLNLVANTAAAGTTGLIGLAGSVSGNTVSLYATNETVGDLDQTYLYGITDTLSATTMPTGEAFTALFAAPAGTNVRGVTFAPEDGAINVPEPGSLGLVAGMLGFGLIWRRRRG